jgi:succinate dehydrogenase/fumarate reductase flavoprotein subunit
MNRNTLIVAAGLAACVATTAAAAQEGYAHLIFSGHVVQEACSTGLAPLGINGAEASCGSGSSRAAFVEHTAIARDTTGVAMLDYFADRPDGGRKFVVTRQYR